MRLTRPGERAKSSGGAPKRSTNASVICSNRRRASSTPAAADGYGQIASIRLRHRLSETGAGPRGRSAALTVSIDRQQVVVAVGELVRHDYNVSK
jgi:hypothetical protein